MGYAPAVRRAWMRRLGAVVISAGMLVATRPAAAAARREAPAASAAASQPATPSDQPDQPDQPDMDEVRRIYDRGKAKFDTADFRGAITEWTAAYAMLPATDANREIRNDIAYNIATAQEKAYDTYKDPVHLRQARQLLQTFLDEYKSMYSPTPETIAEFKKVNERIASLDARIKEAEAQGVPAGTVNAEKQRQQNRLQVVFAADPALHQRYRSGRSMIIGGSVLLGVGGVSALIAAGTAADSRDFGGRPLLVASAIIAVGSIVGGALLLGFGVPKRRRALEEARSRVVFAPTLSDRFAGLAITGRF